MKYEAQILEISSLISGSKNILIALPSEANVDHLAAGLALFLSLEQSGKSPSVATEGVIKVGHSHLFGVGQIENKLPQTEGGDFILTLGGVATSDGKVPAVAKMDYYPSGTDLNLVFRVVPGAKFEPTHITPRFDGGGFDLIFTIGASSLEKLGKIYISNQQVFNGVNIINIDNSLENTKFGKVQIVDPEVSSFSEIVAQILPSLALPFENDIATNTLSGIFAATSNLQGNNVTADTYSVVASAIRVGGKRPIEQPAENPVNMPWINTPTQPTPTPPSADNFTVPPVVSDNNQPPVSAMTEETPSGEAATTTPEADWLTPKIFKGSSIG